MIVRAIDACCKTFGEVGGIVVYTFSFAGLIYLVAVVGIWIGCGFK